MSKVVLVELEWKYFPENYLEEPISIASSRLLRGCYVS